MTVREELREELERALPQGLPAQKRQEAVTRVGAIIERYASPYPDAEYLAQIERIVPGAAELIIRTATQSVADNAELERKEISLRDKEIATVSELARGEFASVSQGRLLGFLAYVCLLIFSGAMFYAGSEKLALAGFAAAVLGVIAQLIRGGGSPVTIRKEKSDE